VISPPPAPRRIGRQEHPKALPILIGQVMAIQAIKHRADLHDPATKIHGTRPSADISDLGEEHGHRVLRVCGKGGKVVLIPLPPAAGRAIDRAVGHHDSGPVLLNSHGTRMDQHAATRRLRRLAETAGIRTGRTHPHMLRHTFVTTMQMSGVASDASLPGKRDHGAVTERDPGSPGPASHQSKTAGQAGRDITMLQRLPRCRVQFGCIAR
jgi:hypothetical protein